MSDLSSASTDPKGHLKFRQTPRFNQNNVVVLIVEVDDVEVDVPVVVVVDKVEVLDAVDEDVGFVEVDLDAVVVIVVGGGVVVKTTSQHSSHVQERLVQRRG
jgi:hypothetical protein